jgi:hypothetical protein
MQFQGLTNGKKAGVWKEMEEYIIVYLSFSEINSAEEQV